MAGDPPNLPVLLIDEICARRYFAGTDPVGKRVRFLADSNGPWYAIIGVVGATHHFGLEAEPRPTIYRAVASNPLYAPILVIRTAGDPAPMLPALTRVIRTAYGDTPVYNVFAMRQLVDRSTSERRFLMWLLTSFAVAGLLLSAIGVYGAISQSVGQRTQELGVRLALGATPRAVLALVFAEGFRITAAGVLVGLMLGWAAARLGRNLLYEAPRTDMIVLVCAPALLALCAAVASYIPARRATRVDPLTTLREE
jgi:hypothetical protein